MFFFIAGGAPSFAIASTGQDAKTLLDLTGHWVGITSLIIFVIAYVVVIMEEFLHLRKSKPVMLAAGLIWLRPSQKLEFMSRD